MSKFSESLTRATDAARVTAIREHEAGRINRQFAPIKAKAAANAAALLAPGRGWMAIA